MALFILCRHHIHEVKGASKDITSFFVGYPGYEIITIASYKFFSFLVVIVYLQIALIFQI